jgi:hypothetical protein
MQTLRLKWAKVFTDANEDAITVVEAGPGGLAVDGILAVGSLDSKVLVFKPGFKSRSGKFSVKAQDPFGAESPDVAFLVTFGAHAREGVPWGCLARDP